MPGVTLGYLRYVLGFDTVSFRKGATEAEVRVQRMERNFKRSFGAINAGFAGFASAFSVGILTAGIKKALDYAGSLGEVSQQLGVTTRDLQVFRYAAGQVGVGQEQLETGLQKLTITMGKVAAGAKAPAAALKAIGVSVDELKGKDTGEVFRIIADGLAKIPDRAQRAAVEVALFGKSGAQLDNLLAGGRKALDELAQAAEKLGIVLGDEQIQRADEAADKLEAVKTVLAANVAGVVADNATSIVSLAQSLASLTSAIVHFLGSNPQAALAIIGALAGSRVGGLPGAAAGAIGGAALGSGLQSQVDQRKLQGNTGLLRHNLQQLTASIRAKREAGQPIKQSELNRLRRLTDKLNGATGRGPSPFAPTGGDIGQFLSSGGGGGSRKGGKDRSAEEAERLQRERLRDAYRFAQDERRGEIDLLRARQELAVNTEDRAKLSLEMLDLGHQGALAEIQYQQDAGEISSAQAKIRVAQEEKLVALQRDAIAAEVAAQKSEDEERMAETRFNIRRADIQAQLNLAQSSDERRRLSLQLLDLEYQEKRQTLERIIANKQLTDAVRSRAQAELEALPRQQSLDQKGVMQSTQGPWESWLQSARNTGDAMQQLKVQGVEGVIDSLTALTQGWQSMGQVARQVLMDILQQMIRIQLMKLFANLLGSAAGAPGGGGGSVLASNPLGGGSWIGGPRARGGPVSPGKLYLVGERGPELATFGRSGRIIPNDKMGSMFGGGGGVAVNVTLPAGMRPSEGRATGQQIARGFQERMAFAATGRRR